MFGINKDLIKDDKQLRLQKDISILASLKRKTTSNPNGSVSFFHDPTESVNLFNTNMSFQSFDKNININGFLEQTTATLHNDNAFNNKTNLSFNLLPFPFQNDTALSFSFDNSKFHNFPIHKTNESFKFNLNQNKTLLTLDKQPQFKEDNIFSNRKHSNVDDEMAMFHYCDSEMAFLYSNNNNNKLETSCNKSPVCVHQNCDFIFRTMKQKFAHHHKMSPECKTDTILLLSNIKRLKNMIKALTKKNKVHTSNLNYKQLLIKYEKIMRNLSLFEHVKLLTGFSLEE